MKKYLPGISIAVVLLAAIALIMINRAPDNVNTTATAPFGRYVAIGDSVAAGIGLADYSDSSACDRTQQAYPNGVAQKLNYSLTSVACSGATTQAGLVGSQDVNRLAVKPQIDTIVTGEKPTLITMTIGANDADWTTYIQKCYTAVCGSDDDTAQVNTGIQQATTNIRSTLDRIKTTYPTNTPRVAITGYYKLFPVSLVGGCTELTGIDQTELAWIAQLQTSIDDALRAASQGYSFATFVPVSFEGHALCTNDSWVQGLGGKAPFHPTAAGQTAIAEQVISAIGKK